MSFVAPIWLLGLLPWGVVTLWLLWGRRKKEPVPFLPLWQGAEGKMRARRAVQTAPIALGAAILAMLLALLAVARPVARSAGGGAITVLVDRGVTMSTAGGRGPRFGEVAESLKQPLLDRYGPGPVTVVDVLSGRRTESDRQQWATILASMPRTAVDTLPMLRAAVASELARDKGPVMLLSDARVEVDDPRFAQVFPIRTVHNAGITALAARELPSSQVMVAVRSDATASAEIHVASAGRESSQKVDLPVGKEQRFFLDLPALGEVIEARLIAPDDLDADNSAWLVREGRSPRVEVRSAISDELRRMVEVYTKTRPPRGDSPVVAVVNRAADLPSGDAGVIIESPMASAKAAGEVSVMTDPITALVNWVQVTKDASVSISPPQGWTPLVKMGDRVLVAKRDSAVRQVWVGFDSPHWPRSVDFVIFWTNVFDWCGGGATEFAAHPVTIVPESWKRQEAAPASAQPNAWPGVFERGDGSLVAMNALDVHFPPPVGSSPALPPADIRGDRRVQLAPWLALFAMACVCVSALTWRRSAANRGEVSHEKIGIIP